MKTLCQYSEEELDNMDEDIIDKIPQCKDYYCFDCYGDRL